MQAAVSLDSVPLSLRLANVPVSYMRYLGNLAWPSNLAVYYPFPQSIPVWQVVSATGLLLVISALSLLAIRQRPFFLVGWLWFLGTLVPAIGVVQAGLWPALADRWVYIPMMGVLVMVVWGGRDILLPYVRSSRHAAIMAALIIMSYACVAHLQARHWRDSVSLFQRAVAVTQDNYVAHDNLGLALAMKGRFEEAFHHFNEALRIEPGFWKAHQNVGAIYLIKGQFDPAINHLTQALKGKPTSARIHTNLGQAYARQGRIEEALASFRTALELDPGNTRARAGIRRLMSPGATTDKHGSEP